MKTFETFADALYELFDHNSLLDETKVCVSALPQGWYLSTVGDDLFSDDGIKVCVFNENGEIDSEYEIGIFTYADLLGTNWIDDIAGSMYNNYYALYFRN